MKIEKEKLFRITAYTSFALITFVFFLYATFPFDIVKKKVLKRVEAESGCKVTIDQSHLSMPIKILAQGIVASCPKRLFVSGWEGHLEIEVASLEVEVSPMALLLKQEAKIDFQAKLGGGVLSGQLDLHRNEGRMTFNLKSIEGKALNLAAIGTGLVGLLSLEGEGSWIEQNLFQGSGRLHFNLDNGRFKRIGGWQIPVGEIAFSKIQGRLSWKEGLVLVEQLSAKSDRVDLEAERGSLRLRRPVDASLVTLSLRAMPKGNIKEMAKLFVQGYQGREALKVRLSGSLRRPQLTVNGRSISLGS